MATNIANRLTDADHWMALFQDAFVGGFYQSVARLAEWVDPDYLGIQPQTPSAKGPSGFLDLMARVYALISDTKVRTPSWGERGNDIFVIVELFGHVAGKPLVLQMSDHFVLRDGLVLARTTYFDPAPLNQIVVRHPRTWWRWWRSGFGYPERRIARRLDPRRAKPRRRQDGKGH